MRLDKLLASSGIGTRSEVRKLIGQKKVTVNGQTANKPEIQVTTEDDIRVNGTPINATTNLYFLLDKPDGVLTAMEDPRLPNVGDYIPNNLRGKKLAPAGRLDYHTSGLLIITNDGTLSHRLQSPRYGIPKIYKVTFKGNDWTDKEIEELKAGIVLTDMEKPQTVKPTELTRIKENESHITLTEGKTHEVRRIFAKYGKEVLSLRRISLAGISIPETEETAGQLRELTKDEITALKKATGSEDGDN